MRKKLKYCCLVVAAFGLLTSCHHDEPGKKVAMNFYTSLSQEGQSSPLQGDKAPAAGNPDESIRRRPAVEEPAETYFHNFRVWCYKTMGTTNGYSDAQNVMNRYVVNWVDNTAGTTTSNTADWEYVGVANPYVGGEVQTIKYWDFGATSYRFFGFAPCNALESSINYSYPALHGDSNMWFDITFGADADHPENAPYISKMWFSNNAGLNKYGDRVKMEFMKPVTKVCVKIMKMDGTIISDPAAEGITYLNFSEGSNPIVKEGKLRVSYPVTGPSAYAFYTPMVNLVGDPTGTTTIPVVITNPNQHYSDFVNVLPHVEQNAYQMELRIGGESKMATVPAQYMSWQPNMQYTYIFKLTEDDFKFIDIVQIGVTEWRTVEYEHNVHNW